LIYAVLYNLGLRKIANSLLVVVQIIAAAWNFNSVVVKIQAIILVLAEQLPFYALGGH